MKTAIGKFWERRLHGRTGEDQRRYARLAEIELGDLLDHSGPRALRAAHDIRLFRAFSEGVPA